jgi:hypothetical protein
MFNGKCDEDTVISTNDRLIKLVKTRLVVPNSIRNDMYVYTLKRKEKDTSLPEEKQTKKRNTVHWNEHGTTKLFRPQHGPTRIK